MDASVFGVDDGVEVGDEVVLLGGQGGERVPAEELGSLAGTINYEITTGVNPRRVERSYEDVRGP
jgi:alanine racemase